jgi:hypothetical protein
MVSSTVQAYAINVTPVWPQGDYHVIVTVEDLVSESSKSATVPFKVAKEEA